MGDLRLFRTEIDKLLENAVGMYQSSATLKELAEASGISQNQLYRKLSLSGKPKISKRDVIDIVGGLAGLEIIKTRSEARALLEIMDVINLADKFWTSEPFDKLDDDSSETDRLEGQLAALAVEHTEHEAAAESERPIERRSQTAMATAPTEQADTAAPQEPERRRYGLKFIFELIAYAAKESTVVQLILLWLVIVVVVMAIIGIVWLAQHH